MRRGWAILLSGLAGLAAQPVLAQGSELSLPATVEAGSAFSIGTTGSGQGTLYIAGLGQVIKRDVELGKTAWFPAGSLYDAGRYVVILAANGNSESGTLDVTPQTKPADLSFLARPSRLPIGLRDGITGAVYVFDAYKNLITAPTPVSFALSSPSGAEQTRSVATTEGAAWTSMDSTAKQGADKFVAEAGDVTSVRVIGQVPGDPCGLEMTAKPDGDKVALATDPVRDCSGNAVPDGTIVTFTETYGDMQSTVDVPLKRDIASVEMPSHNGATISVASGVILGNQIRWGK
ncbi:MAG TPA: hypothetical protein VMD55_01675 [Terracidiphilus sp.]|nr:hypothetical protein [Terracidiphilus sp.]